MLRVPFLVRKKKNTQRAKEMKGYNELGKDKQQKADSPHHNGDPRKVTVALKSSLGSFRVGFPDG